MKRAGAWGMYRPTPSARHAWIPPAVYVAGIAAAFVVIVWA